MHRDMTGSAKVTAEHLRRDAYLYVRQSSLKQVANNTESTWRQYDLRGRAIALGCTDAQITVIDTDQGRSGASSADRDGFQRLVAEVGLGRAGIVLGLEVSRLARNNKSQHVHRPGHMPSLTPHGDNRSPNYHRFDIALSPSLAHNNTYNSSQFRLCV